MKKCSRIGLKNGLLMNLLESYLLPRRIFYLQDGGFYKNGDIDVDKMARASELHIKQHFWEES